MIRVLSIKSEFGDVVPTYFQRCVMCSGTERQPAVALIEYNFGSAREPAVTQIPMCRGCGASLSYGIVNAVGGVSVV